MLAIVRYLTSNRILKFAFFQRYFSTSRDSLTPAYRTTAVSSTASELDLRKKARKKDLRGRLKLPPSVVLLPACGSEPLLRSKNWSEKGSSGGGGNLSKDVYF